MVDVEQKIEEVKNTVEEKVDEVKNSVEEKVDQVKDEINKNEEVEEVEEVGEKNRTMVESIVYTIFNEGIDDNIHKLIRIAFVGLFISLTFLLFITNFNIHIIMLILITTALCITLEWWLTEWDKEKAIRDAETEAEEEVEEEVEEETEEKKTK